MSLFRFCKANFFRFYLPLLLFLLAFVPKLFFITSRDICLDEPFTIFHAQKTVLEILQLPTQNEPNPPLFMLLLHFWIDFFGISASSVRLLPLVFHSLTAVYIYWIARKIRSVSSGIVASLIFLLSSLHFYFALETRTYSLLALATSAALYYFFSIVQNASSKKWILGLIVSNFVLVYSHYFGLYVVFMEFVLSFWYFKDKNSFKKIGIALVLTGVLFSPMLYVIVKQFMISSKGTWVSPPANLDYINRLMLFLNGGFVLVLVLAVLIGGAIYHRISKSQERISKEMLVLVLWWTVPYTLMFLVSKKIPMFVDRYILFNSVGLYLSIAVFTDFCFAQSKRIFYLLIAFLLIPMGVNLKKGSKHYRREVRQAVQAIEKQWNTQTILLIHPTWIDLEFVYYHNPKLFSEVKRYSPEVLGANRIFPVWDLEMAKETLKHYTKYKIIYYQNGSIFTEANNSIFKYLESSYTKVEDTAYPECLNVSVFEPKK